jgi:hypothetical protein
MDKSFHNLAEPRLDSHLLTEHFLKASEIGKFVFERDRKLVAGGIVLR